MDRLAFLVGTVFFAITAIFVVNHFLGLTYSKEGSFDVLTGALVEVFILTVFFEYLNSKQQTQMQKKLQSHLTEIEEKMKVYLTKQK